MTRSVDTEQPAAALAEFWKNRYRRQRELVSAMTSLLSRYGSTVETGELYRTFVLTLMGHFAVGDAALYTRSQDDRALEPTVAYGRTPVSGLPVLPLDNPFIAGFSERRLAGPVHPRAAEAPALGPVVSLASRFSVLAPLHLQNRLVGVIFLGPKLTGQPFLDFDLNVLDGLAAVSATTFNNALLYRNARLSAEELQKLFSVRADVINRISHEFRTPLTVLRAGIETLPETQDGPRTWMADSVRRLETLIESLLALSQGEPAGDAGEYATDPLAAVHHALGAIGTAAAERNIRLSVASTSTVHPGAARVSQDALKIILDALLDNALTYSPDGSSITVEVDVVTGPGDPEHDGVRFSEWVTSTHDTIAEFTQISDALDPKERPGAPAPPLSDGDDTEGHYVVIRVIDEGIGIPAGEIALAAEPFRQASNCPNRGVKGKGLGLALAQRRAAAWGGFICCRSELNVGTVVSVFLPAR